MKLDHRMLSALGLCARIQEAVRDSSHLCECASQGHCSMGVVTVDSDHWRAPIWGLNVGTVSIAMLDGGFAGFHVPIVYAPLIVGTWDKLARLECDSATEGYLEAK